MKYWMIIKQSIKAIFANKGRSFLTVLGIIIGIGSVITLISLGNGVKASISDQITKLGTTTLRVMPGQNRLAQAESAGSNQQRGISTGGGGGFTSTTSSLSASDLSLLSDFSKHANFKAVSASLNGTATIAVSGGQERYQVQGTNDAFFDINNTTGVSKGRLFSTAEVASGSKVIILGSQLASDAYGDTNPIGKTVLIGSDKYQILGVLAKADTNSFNNFNTDAFIPYTAAMVTFKNDNFSTIIVQAKNDTVVDAAKTDIENTLLASHKITDSKLADFSVLSSKDLLSAIGNVTGILTSFLAGIAAISLVVGGIGIMNIMLVSVTERTREIGLRKAVGAKTSDILLQFIVEAILLTLTGGLLGIGLGALLAKVFARLLNLNPVITVSSILLAVSVSSAIGLVFGIYPAAKAARLNPIDALRYE
jgi:putative ABC transport system permease protein